MSRREVCENSQFENLMHFIDAIAPKTIDNGVGLRKSAQKILEEFSNYAQKNCDRFINDAKSNEEDKIAEIRKKKNRIIRDIDFMKKSVFAKIPDFDIDAFHRDPGYIYEVIQNPDPKRSEFRYEYQSSCMEDTIENNLEEPPYNQEKQGAFDQQMAQTEALLQVLQTRTEKFKNQIYSVKDALHSAPLLPPGAYHLN